MKDERDLKFSCFVLFLSFENVSEESISGYQSGRETHKSSDSAHAATFTGER